MLQPTVKLILSGRGRPMASVPSDIWPVCRKSWSKERELGVTFDTIVDAVGSGGTFAGVCLANRLYGLNKRVVGINV